MTAKKVAKKKPKPKPEGTTILTEVDTLEELAGAVIALKKFAAQTRSDTSASCIGIKEGYGRLEAEIEKLPVKLV